MIPTTIPAALLSKVCKAVSNPLGGGEKKFTLSFLNLRLTLKHNYIMLSTTQLLTRCLCQEFQLLESHWPQIGKRIQRKTPWSWMSCHSWKENKKINITSYTDERNMFNKEYNFSTSESLTYCFQTTDQHSYSQEENTHYWRNFIFTRPCIIILCQ